MIPLSVPNIDGNEWQYVKDCLDTGWISSAGAYVTKFEEAIQNYTGVVLLFFVYLIPGTSTVCFVLIPAGVYTSTRSTRVVVLLLFELYIEQQRTNFVFPP